MKTVYECGPGRRRGTTDCRPVFGGEHEKEFLHLQGVPHTAAEEPSMDVVHGCCCGIDMHNNSVNGLCVVD